MNIAVFASHNGSDLQAIINACKSGHIKASVRLVISNNSNSKALVRAKNEGIDGRHISSKLYNDNSAMNQHILDILKYHNIDIIFLAGYLKRVDPVILTEYKNRVFNVHPALLPNYGGQGMYGINVHKAVIEAKEFHSGVTIHRVNEKYDEGEIIARRCVPVMPGDTPETLAARVLSCEHQFIVEVLKDIVEGRIIIE